MGIREDFAEEVLLDNSLCGWKFIKTHPITLQTFCSDFPSSNPANWNIPIKTSNYELIFISLK